MDYVDYDYVASRRLCLLVRVKGSDIAGVTVRAKGTGLLVMSPHPKEARVRRRRLVFQDMGYVMHDAGLEAYWQSQTRALATRRVQGCLCLTPSPPRRLPSSFPSPIGSSSAFPLGRSFLRSNHSHYSHDGHPLLILIRRAHKIHSTPHVVSLFAYRLIPTALTLKAFAYRLITSAFASVHRATVPLELRGPDHLLIR